MAELPRGTITFLFTDIEGSTKRWQHDREAMAAAVARHDALLRRAIEVHGGYVFKTVGDAFCATFATATDALAASLAAQRTLIMEEWGAIGPLHVRMALHTGVTEERDGDYFGQPVNRVARLLGAGHGGQVLLSTATQELVRDLLPEGTSLRDLGEHRLKDLSRPERIFQLIAADLPTSFPPLVTLDHRPNNLPPQLTSLVGREHAGATVRDLLARDDVRLVTLIGPGGTGKTRLSLQVAADLLDGFADGVFFVPLEPVVDPALVADTIAQAVGVREAGGLSVSAALHDYLRSKNLLLVLDNFEHVADAAPVVTDILRACPAIKVLVSSRHALRVQGEREFPVSPLDLPDPTRLPPIDQLAQYEAIRLFVERAQAIMPDFAITDDNAPAVAEICYRLDGLPLALELAAARIRLLPPQAMLARLDSRLHLLTGGARDVSARQQTLRGAIAWSHDLLSAEEQTLFRRLAVFAGGFTLDAAEAVTKVDVLDGVGSLVDKSLLRQEEQDGQPRFGVLQTIREFGLEQLAASGEAEALYREQAAYFVAMVEELEPKLEGPEQVTLLEALEIEHDNFRATLAWSLDGGDPVMGLRLAVALWQLWWSRGHLTEGRSWLERLLTAAAAPPPALRARAMNAGGGLAATQGDYARAAALITEAVALFEQVGDDLQRARAVNNLGIAVWNQGDYARAEALHEEALAIYRTLNDQMGIATSLNTLGNVVHYRGDHTRAAAVQEESLARFRALNDPRRTAVAAISLGVIVEELGDEARARALNEEALTLFQELGWKEGRAVALNNLGDLALRNREYALATSFFEESLSLRDELGDKQGIAHSRFNLGEVAREQGDDERATRLLRESLTLSHEMGYSRIIVDSLEAMAKIAAARGRPERSARLFGAAEARREQTGAPHLPTEVERHEHAVAATHEQLTWIAFAEAWDAGRAFTLDQAVAEAIAETHRG